MYDISGVPSAEVEEAIKADYLHLVRSSCGRLTKFVN